MANSELKYTPDRPLLALAGLCWPLQVNYVRTACVIAVSKAKELLEPFIHQVRRVADAA